MEEDRKSPVKGSDTPDLRGSTDPHYSPDHPKLIEGTEPNTPHESEIENLRDGVEPAKDLKDRFSQN